ncbi:hypothetical protein Pd630_LPD13031 (plasmid) [Rhodococcus opacus PD630]|nr:hypothetical protein Pd630_LPD13031 [Rhodococcus opacus PD630]
MSVPTCAGRDDVVDPVEDVVGATSIAARRSCSSCAAEPFQDTPLGDPLGLEPAAIAFSRHRGSLRL